MLKLICKIMIILILLYPMKMNLPLNFNYCWGAWWQSKLQLLLECMVTVEISIIVGMHGDSRNFNYCWNAWWQSKLQLLLACMVTVGTSIIVGVHSDSRIVYRARYSLWCSTVTMHSNNKWSFDCHHGLQQ